MVHRNGRNWKSGLAGVAVLSLSSLWVWAQEGTPFGRGASTPASDSSPKPSRTTPTPLAEEHVVVLAIRETNPSTPEQWLNALRIMVDIAQHEEALQYLGKLEAANLNDETAFELHRQVGTGLLLELSRIPELQPAGHAFSKRILEGATRFSRDPVRIDQLISQLDDSSIKTRTAALDELRTLDVHGINAVLARSSQADERQQVVLVDTLQAWGASAEPALIAALRSSDEAIQQVAIETLGRRQSQGALIAILEPLWNPASSDSLRQTASVACERILGHVPSRSESIQRIHRAWQAREIQLGNHSARDSWTWNESTRAVERSPQSTHTSAVLDRARMAETLASLDPASDEFQMLAWRGRLALAQAAAGPDQSVQASSLPWINSDPVTVDRLLRLLSLELQESEPPGAVAALHLIAQLGSSSLLWTPSGEACVVVEALNHSDRSVRLAAAQTILTLAPERSFPGSNRLVSSLCFFIRSEGQQRVLIGHPNRQDVQTLAGTLSQIGVVAQTATNGRDLFMQAVANPDLEAILLSEYLDGPETYELVQQLRRDPRTAEIPIGLVFNFENLDRARRIARDEERVHASVWPYGVEVARLTLDQIASTVGHRVPGQQIRESQAQQAMQLLMQAADQPRVYSFDDLMAQQQTLIDMAYSSSYSVQAMGLLGIVATPESQRALLYLIGEPLYPVSQRQAALDALEMAIARRGLLLTTREIQNAYDRRNAAGAEGVESQQVLDRMLDILEAPSGLSSRSNP